MDWLLIAFFVVMAAATPSVFVAAGVIIEEYYS